MKAGSVINLPPSRAQSGRPKPCRSCDSHGDFSSVTVVCRPESQFVPSTSSCCSITGFRDSRRAFISDNPQCAGWGRFEACHREAGRSRKHGPADGAPRRRARFDEVVRRLHRTTRRDRIDECVSTGRVLPRRKRRLLPRTPVHKGALRLPRRRPGLALPGVARGPALGKTSVLCNVRRRGTHIKRVARRRKRPARGRAKRSTSCGRLRGSAFVSSVQPSDGHNRRVGRKTSVPPSRRNRSQASKKRRRASHCEPDSTRSSGGRRKSDAAHCKEVPPEPVSKTNELSASRPKKKRLSTAPTSRLSGKRASEREEATGVRPVSKAQVVYDSRGKDHAASDIPGGSHVEAKPKAQQQNNEGMENDVIFSELDETWGEFGRGIRRSGSRARQRRNGSIEAVPRGAPQVLSPDQGSTGGGDGLIDGWPCGAQNEEPPLARLRLPPRRGWLRDLPAKGPLPQHGVYIGRSYGAFCQPQGWENPFKPDPRKGKQGLQEVVDAYEQHLCQSQVLVDRLPELSGKVLNCHCKPTDPCHADALLRAWEQNVDGPPRTVAPGVGRMLKKSLARLVEKDKLSLIGGFEIKDMVEMDLHCIASVLSTVP